MSQKGVLIKESIQTKKSFTDNKEATVAAGNILFENGYVEQEYVDSMLEKLERSEEHTSELQSQD